MEGVLDKCLTPTTEMIANLIEIENAHINTNHPDFVGSADSMLNLFSTQPDGPDDLNGTPSKQYGLMPNQNPNGSDYLETGIQDAQIIDENGSEDQEGKGYLSMLGGKLGLNGAKNKNKGTPKNQ